MFGDVGQARTNATMFLMPIDTTSNRTCTKPIVSRSFYLVCVCNHFSISFNAVGEKVCSIVAYSSGEPVLLS